MKLSSRSIIITLILSFILFLMWPGLILFMALILVGIYTYQEKNTPHAIARRQERDAHDQRLREAEAEEYARESARIEARRDKQRNY